MNLRLRFKLWRRRRQTVRQFDRSLREMQRWNPSAEFKMGTYPTWMKEDK